MRRSVLPVGGMLLTLLATVLLLADLTGPALRSGCAILLVLALPGYILATLLFAGQADMAERVLEIVGFSLILVVLAGLALNGTGVGLHRVSWVVLLAGLALIGELVILHNKVSGRSGAIKTKPKSIGVLSIAAFLLAGALLAASIWIAVRGADQQSRSSFTQLWVVSPNDDVSGVRLAIRNLEGQSMVYHLAVQIAGATVAELPGVFLGPDEAGEFQVGLPPRSAAAGPERVDVLLYRDDAPQAAYRHAILWR